MVSKIFPPGQGLLFWRGDFIGEGIFLGGGTLPTGPISAWTVLSDLVGPVAKGVGRTFQNRDVHGILRPVHLGPVGTWNRWASSGGG